MRLLSAFRDPRIWLVVVLAIGVRVGWTVYWNRQIGAEVQEFEAELAAMSHEERLEARTQLARGMTKNVLGVELDDEPRPPKAETRAIGPGGIPVVELNPVKEAEPARETPIWLFAGMVGVGVLAFGVAGSLLLLKQGSGTVEEPLPPDA